MSRTLTIETAEGKKGRSFSAELLCFVTADHLWDGGRTNSSALRPVVMVIAGSDAQMGPFVANLRGGRKAVESSSYRSRGDRRFELLRSAGYAFAWQRFPEGAVVTAYLPDLIRLDPGMVNPAGAKFLLLPAKEWVGAELARIDVDGLVAHADAVGLIGGRWGVSAEEARDFAPLASLFVAYLDRRVRAPIVADARFHMQVLLACIERGYAVYVGQRDRGRVGMAAERFDECGFGLPIAFQAKQEQIDTLLAEQVQTYFGRRAA